MIYGYCTHPNITSHVSLGLLVNVQHVFKERNPSMFATGNSQQNWQPLFILATGAMHVHCILTFNGDIIYEAYKNWWRILQFKSCYLYGTCCNISSLTIWSPDAASNQLYHDVHIIGLAQYMFIVLWDSIEFIDEHIPITNSTVGWYNLIIMLLAF